ncbi:hypothetical protein DESC_720473 [Desulfosarcina cetonica]|nr:hypothetical protein DESC_720473 [Desulfosarcina cetonica]
MMLTIEGFDAGEGIPRCRAGAPA